jgi:hypothetical protein
MEWFRYRCQVAWQSIWAMFASPVGGSTPASSVHVEDESSTATVSPRLVEIPEQTDPTLTPSNDWPRMIGVGGFCPSRVIAEGLFPFDP